MYHWMAVGAGGALGTLLRWACQEGLKGATAWPWPTWTVNLLGSFVAGLLWGTYGIRGSLSEPVRLALFVGFLGGFTTFSSFSLETIRLWTEESQPLKALAYAMLSPAAGIGLCAFGIWLAHQRSWS